MNLRFSPRIFLLLAFPTLITPVPTPCTEFDFKLILTTDNWPAETSWTLVNHCTGKVVADGDLYNFPGTTYEEQECIPIGMYTFTIADEYGDGICCEEGSGSYTVEYNGDIIKEGGMFEFSESTTFGSWGCPTTPSPIPPTAPTPCTQDDFKLMITTDDYPEETIWTLVNQCTGQVEANGGHYLIPESDYEEEKCIPSIGMYTFTIIDTFGNGICCMEGSAQGSYTIEHNGDIIKQGGQFETADSTTFGSCVVPDQTLTAVVCGGNYGCKNDAEMVDPTTTHEVRCCSDTFIEGWSKNNNCDVWAASKVPTCHHDMDFVSAEAICTNAGGRLCSAEELYNKCTKGSGCRHDWDLIWSDFSITIDPIPPANPSHYLACGASHKDCAGTVEVADNDSVHEVRCCSDTLIEGWNKRNGCDVWSASEVPTCFHKSTYVVAKHICAWHGARLCTKQELLDDCSRGTGCNHDSDMLWSSTPFIA